MNKKAEDFSSAGPGDSGTEAPYYIGLLHFDSEPGKEVEEVLNKIPPFRNIHGQRIKIIAEHVTVHEIPIDYQTKYRLILDRSSHRLMQAVGLLKMFAYRGVNIVNNPLSFWWFVDNKDAAYGMMRDLGLAIPKTYLLPQHTTPYLDQTEFGYHRHFDWEKMMSDIGWPCYIKPADGRGAIDCNRAETMEELIGYYDESGTRVMMVQEAIQSPHEWHVRCLCIGRKIIPMKFIFRKFDLAEYIWEEDFLPPAVLKQVIEQSRIINRAFGYEMNSVEFVIDESEKAWAIDFNNPVPDGRREKLGDEYFAEYVKALVTVAVDKAWYDVVASFLPDLNEYAQISRQEISPVEKYARALSSANNYYDKPTPPVLEDLL